MAVIKLSKRMQTVADMANGKRIADIGCDHAFVSIYLMQSKKAENVIAMDVKKGPISIAEDNIKMYGLQDFISVRLSNGFSAVKVGEIDCAIIAGMGGRLIVDILRAGSCHMENGINLVLQPQSDIDEVRRYLYENSYKITEEQMLVEEGKYYTIIKAEQSDNVSEYSEVELLYGRYLLNTKNEILKQYLKDSKQKNCMIKESLKLVHTDSSDIRLHELEHENAIIDLALQLYNS